MTNLTFYEYLSQQVESGVTDDPAGDFAIDAARDRRFPRQVQADAEGFIEVFNYLYYSRSVLDTDVLGAFMDCWEMYYKETTGGSWYY